MESTSHILNNSFSPLVNLFYLTPGSRQRIEKKGDYWLLQESTPPFDEKRLLEEQRRSREKAVAEQD